MPRAINVGVVSVRGLVLHNSGGDGDATPLLLGGLVNVHVVLELGMARLRKNCMECYNGSQSCHFNRWVKTAICYTLSSELHEMLRTIEDNIFTVAEKSPLLA